MKDIVANNENLKRLMEGNKRYVSSHLQHPDQSSERRFELKHGQHPFAIILGCSDSRVPPEVIFDQGLGDLYVVRVAGNVLSDCAAMLTGSIGMLPSASLNKDGFGMYEPIHGSAPDIAGQDLANPLATILSVSMMLRYSLNQAELADRIDSAVNTVLDQGYRTQDIASEGDTVVGTSKMGDLVVKALQG